MYQVSITAWPPTVFVRIIKIDFPDKLAAMTATSCLASGRSVVSVAVSAGMIESLGTEYASYWN